VLLAVSLCLRANVTASSLGDQLICRSFETSVLDGLHFGDRVKLTAAIQILGQKVSTTNTQSWGTQRSTTNIPVDATNEVKISTTIPNDDDQAHMGLPTTKQYQALTKLNLRMGPTTSSSKTGDALAKGEIFVVMLPEPEQAVQHQWAELEDGRGWVPIFDHALVPQSGTHWTQEQQNRARVARAITNEK
jgi:hypothetical protein